MNKNKNFQTLAKSTGSFVNKYAIYFVFIIIFIILTFATDKFFTSKNLINITRQVSINGVVAVGMTLVILTGGIDLSVGSLVAVAGIIMAKFAHIPNELPWIPGIFVAIAAAAALGLFTGFFVAKFNVPSFIQTLAMMTMARGTAKLLSNGRPISTLYQEYISIGNQDFLGLPILAWIFIVVFIIGYVVLHHTALGRYIYAVGGNSTAARNSGINVIGVHIFVYLFMGLLCGIAGVMLSARVSTGMPNGGEGYELDSIAAVVIGGTSLSGGKGLMFGTLVGLLIIGIMNNGLDLLGVSSFVQEIVKGAIIALAVLLDSLKVKQQ